MALSPRARTLVAVAFLVAVGFGLVAPVLPVLARSFGAGVGAASAVSERSDRRHGGTGSAMAGFQMTGDLGAVLGPFVVGLAVDLGDNVSGFGTAAVVAGVGLLMWVQVPERGS